MKVKILWIAAAAFLCGVAFVAGRYFGRSEETAWSASAHAIIEVSALHNLYAGDTNRAARHLEFILDSDTYHMAKIRDQIITPGPQHQLGIGISRVVRFRREHPRTPLAIPQEEWQQTDAKEWRDFVQTESAKVREHNAVVDSLLREEK